MFGDDGFVELQAEAGGVVQEELAVADRVPAADEGIAPGDVEFSEGFLNVKVRRADVEVEGGGEGDGADGDVRRDSHVLRRAHRGDLLAEEQPAAVGQIR